MKFSLPIGYEIESLTADINERCYKGGPFRHPVEYQLERFCNPETRERARFKLSQMATEYTVCLMHQFSDLPRTISHATLAMQIMETLIKSTKH